MALTATTSLDLVGQTSTLSYYEGSNQEFIMGLNMKNNYFNQVSLN